MREQNFKYSKGQCEVKVKRKTLMELVNQRIIGGIVEKVGT